MLTVQHRVSESRLVRRLAAILLLMHVGCRPFGATSPLTGNTDGVSDLELVTSAQGAINGRTFGTQPVVYVYEHAPGSAPALLKSNPNVVIEVSVFEDLLLLGSTRVRAVNGVARFTDLGIHGQGKTLHLTYQALPDGPRVFQTLALAPSDPVQLCVVTSAFGATSGSAFRLQPSIGICDDSQNLVSTDNGRTVTAASSTGATLSGLATVTAKNGIAQFSDLGLTGVGTFSLTFTAAKLRPTSHQVTTSATLVPFTFLASLNGASPCALTPTGAAYCWGFGHSGQRGDGSSTDADTLPTPVKGGPFTSITTSGGGGCGLDSGGKAWCWGMPPMLGSGGVAPTNVPTAVAGGLTFTSITAAPMHVCGIATDARTYCWGYNSLMSPGVSGRLGDGTLIDRYSPVEVATPLRFVSLTAGYRHTCGLTSDGSAYCWGTGPYGAVDDSVGTHTTPVQALGGRKYALISGACGITLDGTAYCYRGPSDGKQYPATVTTPTTSSVDGTTGAPFTQIFDELSMRCGLTADGTAYCWGEDSYGRFGNGQAVTSAKTVPVPVSGGYRFASLALGTQTVCGITTDGVLLCWGDNSFGQIGDGTRTARYVPTRVILP